MTECSRVDSLQLLQKRLFGRLQEGKPVPPSNTKCDDSLYMFSSFRGSLRPRNLFDVGGDDCSGASLFYSASAFIGETHPKSIRSLRSQHFARSAPLSDFVSTGVPFLPLRYQKMYNDLSQMV